MKKGVVTTFVLFILFQNILIAKTDPNNTANPQDPKKLKDAFLELSKLFHSQEEIAECNNRIRQMSQELKRRITKQMEPKEKLSIINNFLFGELKFKYVKSKDNFKYVMLPSVVLRKSGNCIGLSELYVCLGELLDLPLFMVSAPNHCFVRYEESKKYLNIETSDNGKHHNNEEYMRKFRIPKNLINNTYLSTHTKAQIISLVKSNIGVIYLKQEKYKQSITFLKSAIQNIYNNPEILSNLGCSYLQTGEIEKATYYFKKSVKLHPQKASYHANLAQAYNDSKQYLLSIAEYSKAIKLAPEIEKLVKDNLSNLHYILGQDFFNSNKYSEALNHWETYIKMVPDDGNIHNNLAIIYYIQKEYNKAWEHVILADKYKSPVDRKVRDAIRKAFVGKSSD